MYLAKWMLQIEIKNPDKSENKWAASETIAKEPANIPPANSTHIRMKQTILTFNKSV